LAEKNVLARINVGDLKITAQIGFKYHKKRGLSRGWLDQQKPQLLPVFKSIRALQLLTMLWSTLWGHPESGYILYALVVYTCREKGYLRIQTAPKKGGRVEG
jgi:hypothetical protein